MAKNIFTFRVAPEIAAVECFLNIFIAMLSIRHLLISIIIVFVVERLVYTPGINSIIFLLNAEDTVKVAGRSVHVIVARVHFRNLCILFELDKLILLCRPVVNEGSISGE